MRATHLLVPEQIETSVSEGLTSSQRCRPNPSSISTQLGGKESLQWVCALQGGGWWPRASKRPTASPGSLVSGTVLHVLADHATVQLDYGEQADIHLVLPAALRRWYVFVPHSHAW